MAVSISKKATGTTKRVCKNSQCHSTFQDRLYGLGVRVFNCKAGGVRCTVCGTEIKES